MYLTGLELLGCLLGAAFVGCALGMFIMAALAVGREENREADEDE